MFQFGIVCVCVQWSAQSKDDTLFILNSGHPHYAILHRACIDHIDNYGQFRVFKKR